MTSQVPIPRIYEIRFLATPGRKINQQSFSVRARSRRTVCLPIRARSLRSVPRRLRYHTESGDVGNVHRVPVQCPRPKENRTILCILLCCARSGRERYAFKDRNIRSVSSDNDPHMSKGAIDLRRSLRKGIVGSVTRLENHIMHSSFQFHQPVLEIW